VEAPASFQPPPPPGEAPKGQGCARSVLIGCGIAALLGVACVVGFFLYIRRNPGVMTDLMMRQIESHWGADVTEEDKADLRAAYAEFRAALNARRVNPEGVQRIQFSISSARNNTFNRDQVRQLAQALREAARGSTSPGPTSLPSPVPTRSP